MLFRPIKFGSCSPNARVDIHFRQLNGRNYRVGRNSGRSGSGSMQPGEGAIALRSTTLVRRRYLSIHPLEHLLGEARDGLRLGLSY